MRIRVLVLMRSPTCAKCSTPARPVAAREVDHIVPLSKGGTDHPDNLQGLCRDCHADKTAIEQGKTRRPVIGLDGWPQG